MSTSSSEEKKQFSSRVAFAILIGNFVEYFDFLLFVQLSFIISPLFFPADNPVAQNLGWILGISLGWIIRPVSALIMGRLADFTGRKKMLIVSTVIMGVATFLLASLPTYEQIGIFASILVLFCRALQGFGNVGEFVGSTVYVVQNSPKRIQSIRSCLVYVTSTSGSLCATLCGYVCMKATGIDEYYRWRIPFFIGGGIIFLGGVLRKLLPQDGAPTKRRPFLWDELKDKYWPALGGILVNMCHPIVFTLVYAQIPALMSKQLHIDNASILLQNVLVMAWELVVVTTLGYLGDKISVSRIAYFRSALIAILAVPCVFLIVFGSGNAASQILWLSPQMSLFAAQLTLILFSHAEIPLLPSIVNKFAGARVYTSYGLIWGTGRSLMYVLSFVLFWGAESLSGYAGLPKEWGFVLVLLWMAASYALGVYLMFRPDKAALSSRVGRPGGTSAAIE